MLFSNGGLPKVVFESFASGTVGFETYGKIFNFSFLTPVPGGLGDLITAKTAKLGKATLRVSAPLPAYQLHTSAQPLRSITSADFAQQTFELPSSATNSKPSVKSLIKSKILASPSDAPRSGDLRERFIQRLILDGKKSTATKVFDESLDILYQQYKEAQKSDPKLIPQTKSDLFLTCIVLVKKPKSG